jgi:hypothetical protein
MKPTPLYSMFNKSVEELEEKIAKRLKSLDEEIKLVEALAISTKNPPPLIKNTLTKERMAKLLEDVHAAMCTNPRDGCAYCWGAKDGNLGKKIRQRANLIADTAETFGISLKLAAKYELVFNRLYLNTEFMEITSFGLAGNE